MYKDIDLATFGRNTQKDYSIKESELKMKTT
jgi:hypothetical protein